MSLISAAQQAANQANAQLAHGPKTEAGKRRSSFNALRHGLTGRVVVLPAEDLSQYQAFSQKMLADIGPKGAVEEQLAQTIVDTQWRLNRIRSIEEGLFALGAANVPSASGHAEIDSALAAAQAFKDNAPVFNNLSVYEQRLLRLMEKTFAELHKLQGWRANHEQLALHQAVHICMELKRQGKPFNPAEFGFDFSAESVEAEIMRCRGLNSSALRAVGQAPPNVGRI